MLSSLLLRASFALRVVVAVALFANRSVDAMTGEARRVIRAMQQRDVAQRIAGGGVVLLVLVVGVVAAYNSVW